MDEKHRVILKNITAFMLGYSVVGIISSIIIKKSDKNFNELLTICQDNHNLTVKLAEHIDNEDTLRSILDDWEFERITRKM